MWYRFESNLAKHDLMRVSFGMPCSSLAIWCSCHWWPNHIVHVVDSSFLHYDRIARKKFRRLTWFVVLYEGGSLASVMHDVQTVSISRLISLTYHATFRAFFVRGKVNIQMHSFQSSGWYSTWIQQYLAKCFNPVCSFSAGLSSSCFPTLGPSFSGPAFSAPEQPRLVM